MVAVPQPGPVPVALVRHGQTDWNLARRVQGHTDVPLNDVGRSEAAEAGRLLGGGGWQRVVTSTLSRAAETGTIIAQALALPEPPAVAALMERDYGEAEGFTVDDYRALQREPEGMEPWEAVVERSAGALRELVREDRRPLVAVAHGGVLRALLLAASAGAVPEHGVPILNGAIAGIGVDPDAEGHGIVFLRAPSHEPYSVPQALSELQGAERNASTSSAASRGRS